jgi:hypothetical protein
MPKQNDVSREGWYLGLYPEDVELSPWTDEEALASMDANLAGLKRMQRTGELSRRTPRTSQTKKK